MYRRDGGTARESVAFPVGTTALGVPVPADLPSGWPDHWVAGDSAEGNAVRAHLDDGGPTIRGRADNGTVVFEPAEGGEELTARGEIQADGTFRLRTKDTLGAVEGKHRVLIQPADAGDDSRPAPRPFHPRFESFEKSKLVTDAAASIGTVMS